MSVISQITDYEARLVNLLPTQFKTQTNWLKLFNALAESGKALQDQEDLVFLLWQQRSSLGSAVGAQLDQWGALLGLPREGWTDMAYRARLLVWLQVLRSNGTPDELIQIAGTLAGGVGNVTYWEHPPASFSIQVSAAGIYSSDPDLAQDLAGYVRKAKPAGVDIGQIVDTPAPAFIFGTAGANGFSQEGGTTRGLLCVDLSTL